MISINTHGSESETFPSGRESLFSYHNPIQKPVHFFASKVQKLFQNQTDCSYKKPASSFDRKN